MTKRNQSLAVDVVEITSKLPWWVGLFLAVGSYIGLHSLATKGLPQAQAGDISQALTGGLIYTFASLGQYFLPVIFSIGSVLSAFMTIKRKRLHSNVTSGDKKVADINWYDFELLIGEHFRRQGFTVDETKTGADGGIDLVLKKDSGKYLVQCKHYKAYKVGVKPVREVLGVMVSCGATGGYVVTSGQFTKDAMSFAEDNKITLIDGSELQRILKAIPKKPRALAATDDQITTALNNNAEEGPGICPKCGSSLVVRVARQGNRAGQKFLGCSKFPGCRFTKQID